MLPTVTQPTIRGLTCKTRLEDRRNLNGTVVGDLGVLGSWFVVLGAWCLVLGAWCLVLGAWCFVLGASFLVLGAWFLVLGAWCFVCVLYFLLRRMIEMLPEEIPR